MGLRFVLPKNIISLNEKQKNRSLFLYIVRRIGLRMLVANKVTKRLSWWHWIHF